MNPQEQREQLMIFCDALPETVQNELGRKDIDIFVIVNNIASAQGLVLGEMGGLYESVRRVLAGEDSPSNLAAFISQDPNIEEDNRPKIPAIASEIQKQIFDPVLPLLRQAGMTVKEGRVTTAPAAQAAFSGERLAVSIKEKEQPITPPRPPAFTAAQSPAVPPAPSELTAKRYPPPGGLNASLSAPLDERHLRALARIAAGTGHTEEELIEQFHTLPEGLRRAITTVDTANAIQDIAKRFLLHIDQMAALASETGLVLLGLTHPRNFVKNLAARLHISEQRALEIAREVSEQILSKVRETLRGLHEEVKPQQPTTLTPSQPSPHPYASPTRRFPSKEGQMGGGEPLLKKLGVLAEQEEKIPRPADGTLPLQNPPPPSSVQDYGRAQRGLGASFSKGETGELGQTASADSSLNAKRYPLNASSTPFSAQWKTEDESLTREEVLRDIESPNLNVKRYPPAGGLNASPVGPTGWRPPQRAPSVERLAVSKIEEENQSTPKLPRPPRPTLTTPPQSSPKETPSPPQHHASGYGAQRGLGASPLKRGSGEVGEEEDFLEEKLSGPTGAAHTESRYTIDPYREPTE